jgi:hypothetical protein
MDRDIFRCQEMQKVASGVGLHIDSYDLRATGFFDKNEFESVFYSLLLVVSFSSYGRFFPFSGVAGRNFVHKCSVTYDIAITSEISIPRPNLTPRKPRA